MFNEIIERKNTNCTKYDALKLYFGYEDLQPLWIADMDFKTSKAISDAVIKRAEHGIYGYTKPTQKTYELVKEWIKKRHGWDIETNWIIFANGVVPSYSAAIEAFSEEGDEIIIQTPVYPPLFNSIKANNRIVVKNSLVEKNGYYTMDLEDLKSKISPRTKILTLCSPHNPVGRVWDKEELEELAKICIENNIVIISDEIHADIVFKKFTPLASVSKDISNITLTLNSPGKTFNTPGLNCSYAISENKNILEKFRKECEKREISNISVFGFTGLEAAYEFGEKWLEELLIYLKGNIKFAKEFLIKSNANIYFLEPEATYLLWLSFKKCEKKHQKIKTILLEKAKIALNDGRSFGIEGDLYFRLNYALPKTNLEKALSKIVTCL